VRRAADVDDDRDAELEHADDMATSVSSVPAAQVLAAAQSDDELPFTGTPAENTAIVGAVVLAAGTAFVGGSKIRKRGRA
jgi:hypothetical protein